MNDSSDPDSDSTLLDYSYLENEPDNSCRQPETNKSLKYKPFVCDFSDCNEKFETFVELNKHKEIHCLESLTEDSSEEKTSKKDQKERFCCKECNQTFLYEKYLESHIKRVHLKRGSFICDFIGCNQRFYYKSILIKHRLTHTDDRPFKCDVKNCDKRFKSEASVNDHKNAIHLGIKYKCDYKECNQTFSSTYLLNRHKQTIHLNVRNHVCDVCNKSFKRKDTLDEHKRSHLPEKRYKCEFKGCDKRFRDSQSYKEHKNNIHLNIKLRCDWKGCKQRFASKSCLRRHKNTVHLNQRLFVCECNKTFKRKDHMNIHKLKFHNEKNEN